MQDISGKKSIKKRVAVWLGILVGIIAFVRLFWEQIVMGVVFLVFTLITSQSLGTQMEGVYYVERINSSTNACVGGPYMHLWESDTPLGGEIYSYDLERGTSEKILENDPDYASVKESLQFPTLSDELWENITDALHDEGCAGFIVSAQNLDQTENPVVGITQIPVIARVAHDRIEQKQLRRDVLFSYDVQTGACEILYRPENNRTRIIGYEDGVMYLYEKDAIYKKPLDGRKEKLATLPPSDSYTFDWWDGKLIVLDHETNELVEVLEI